MAFLVQVAGLDNGSGRAYYGVRGAADSRRATAVAYAYAEGDHGDVPTEAVFVVLGVIPDDWTPLPDGDIVHSGFRWV
jgi:hypothetical protein